ncbi:MAG: precorrin-3B C(17)-methyltransferase, partial [Mycobacteriaceae bacterium]
ILPGTLPVAELTQRLKDTDSAVVMKLGRTYPAVRQALVDSGRIAEAQYVERASTPQQRVLAAADVVADEVPYFSIAVLPSISSSEIAQSTGEVVVVGLGPGDTQWTTPEVSQELKKATDLIGYAPYIDRVPFQANQIRHSSDNRVEAERAAMALDLAQRGRRVVVVSSGDPGVFAMAAAVLEVSCQPPWQDIPVRVLPGVTAANAVASKVGAPLGHDYVVISLSDRLKPWEIIARRLLAAAEADFAIAIYNPASQSRRWQISAMREILLEYRSESTPVVVGRDVGSKSESVDVTTLGKLDPEKIDMRCLLIIGSSQTSMRSTPTGPMVFTSRSYPS